jgi:hypothetical protein
MLARTDSQLAHLAIAATAVERDQRQRWLRAHRSAAPSPCPSPARKSRQRARPRNGERVFKLVANYELIVSGLIGSGRISERDALDHGSVERVLSAMLTNELARRSFHRGLKI